MMPHVETGKYTVNTSKCRKWIQPKIMASRHCDNITSNFLFYYLQASYPEGLCSYQLFRNTVHLFHTEKLRHSSEMQLNCLGAGSSDGASCGLSVPNTVPGIANSLSLGISVLMFQLELDMILCGEGYCSLFLVSFILPLYISPPQSLLVLRVSLVSFIETYFTSSCEFLRVLVP